MSARSLSNVGGELCANWRRRSCRVSSRTAGSREEEKSAYKLPGEFEQVRRQYWGGHLWARGYFCCSSRQVTDEVIKQYIANHGQENDDDFRVEGEESPST